MMHDGMPRHVLVQVASAVRGRANIAGCGAVLLHPDTRELLGWNVYRFTEPTTPEVADVMALTIGVRRARDLGWSCLTVQSESQRVIDILTAKLTPKPGHIRVYAAIARQDLDALDKVVFERITEDLNEPAHWLAEQARKGGLVSAPPDELMAKVAIRPATSGAVA